MTSARERLSLGRKLVLFGLACSVPEFLNGHCVGMIRPHTVASWSFVLLPLLMGTGLILEAYAMGVADGDERIRGRIGPSGRAA